MNIRLAINTYHELKQFQPHTEITGSYAFGNATPRSDFDVFTEQKKGLERFLFENGFTLISSPYQDMLIQSVWFNPNIPMHVQVVNNFRCKQKAQEFLLDMPFSLTEIMNKNMGNIRNSKAYKAAIWDWAIDICSKMI